MTLTTALLKAPHIGVRDLKAHLSERLKSHRPLVVTEHGEPKQVMMPYHTLIELAEILEETGHPGKKNHARVLVLSESSLKKDWLKPEEDKAWQNL